MGQQYKNGSKRLRAVAIGAAGRSGRGRGRKTRTTRQNEGIYRLRRTVFLPAGDPRRGEATRDGKDMRAPDGIHWTIRETGTRTPPVYLPISGLRLHLLLRICPPIRLLDRPDPARVGIECVWARAPFPSKVSALPWRFFFPGSSY